MADYSILVPTGVYQLTGNAALLDQSDHPIECRGEWIDLEAAMTMLGAPSNQEETVELLIAEIGALITAYLGRNLLDCTHTDTFFRPDLAAIYLNHWPVTKLYSIRYDGTRTDLNAISMNGNFGIIYKACDQPFNPNNYCGEMTVNYDAGFTTPPLELGSMFRAILSDYYSSGGSTEGSVGSIKKVNLTGVAAVEFNSPGISYSGVDQQLGVPNVLKQYTGMLDRYKSDRVMGVI